MISVEAKLVIDLGNSETRVMTIFGKNAKGQVRSKLSCLDNRYAIIPQRQLNNVLSNGTYDEDNSKIFRKNSDIYCNGEMCNKEFGPTTIRPSGIEKKYKAFTTDLALINAFRQGFSDIADFTNSGYGQADVSWSVGILLPPQDIEAGAELIREKILNVTHIDFMMPEFSTDVKIKTLNGKPDIKVYPEGFCAFIATVFRSKSELRKGFEYLGKPNETTLICDVGAGTTDFLLVQGSQVVSTSKYTYNVGGNNVHRYVQKILRDSGQSFPDSVIREGCETGVIRRGAKVLDIVEEIAEAKHAISNQLVNEAIVGFFESSSLEINTINNLLVCGGGAELSNVKGIEPLSKYIVEYMKRLSPDIRLVEIPVDDDGKRMSTRMLNIYGAGILL